MNPAQPGTVFIARHGETDANSRGVYSGRSSDPINAAGRAQAVALAEQLEGVGIRQVWSSTIVRAAQTAGLIAEELRVPVVQDHRLDEMRMGPWKGLSETTVRERFPSEYQLWTSEPDRLRVPGRETLPEVADRMGAVVDEAKTAGVPTLLVSHVAPIRVACLSSLREPLRRYRDLTVSNCDCFVLGQGEPTVRRLGQAASLRTEL